MILVGSHLSYYKAEIDLVAATRFAVAVALLSQDNRDGIGRLWSRNRLYARSCFSYGY